MFNPFTLVMIPIGIYATALSYVAQGTWGALGRPPGETFQPPPPNSALQPDPWWYPL